MDSSFDHGDPEDALAPTKDVDNFLLRVRRVDRLSIAQQGHICQRLIRIELNPKNLNRRSNLLEAHSRIEKSLDHLELNHVSERVKPLGSGTCRLLQCGHDQLGSCPIVKLSVGDTDQLANLWGAVARLPLLGHSILAGYTCVTRRGESYRQGGLHVNACCGKLCRRPTPLAVELEDSGLIRLVATNKVLDSRLFEEFPEAGNLVFFLCFLLEVNTSLVE